MLGGNLMFGHQDDSQPADSQATMTMNQDDTNDYSQAAPVNDMPAITDGTDNNMPEDGPADNTVPEDDENKPAQDNEPDENVLGSDANIDSDTKSTFSDSYSSGNTASPANDDNLLDIKQQALGQLSPIVNHLNQTPEEKFRTIMMMIQASDNQSLIKDAYEAAQAISDDKVKAQALLDVVNEINYFTHQGSSDEK